MKITIEKSESGLPTAEIERELIDGIIYIKVTIARERTEGVREKEDITIKRGPDITELIPDEIDNLSKMEEQTSDIRYTESKI